MWVVVSHSSALKGLKTLSQLTIFAQAHHQEHKAFQHRGWPTKKLTAWLRWRDKCIKNIFYQRTKHLGSSENPMTQGNTTQPISPHQPNRDRNFINLNIILTFSCTEDLLCQPRVQGAPHINCNCVPLMSISNSSPARCTHQCWKIPASHLPPALWAAPCGRQELKWKGGFL